MTKEKWFEVLQLCRDYRGGAMTRREMGGSVGDDGYQTVWDDMKDDANRLGVDWYIFLRAAQSGDRMAQRKEDNPC